MRESNLFRHFAREVGNSEEVRHLSDATSGTAYLKTLCEGEITRLAQANYLYRSQNLLCPGFLLNVAKAQEPPNDLIELLPEEQSDELHLHSLMNCLQVERTKTIQLLHARYLTTCYFNCDALIARAAASRSIVIDVLRELVSRLHVDFVACTIAPEGLVGSYPLCFYLAVGKEWDVIASLSRAGSRNFVGGLHPPPGIGLILNDVLTTGTSILQLKERIVNAGSGVAGAVVVYDRREGGREELAASGLDVISLMSVDSLRRYCIRVLRAEGLAQVVNEKAKAFLEASERVVFTEKGFGHTPAKNLRIALGPGLAPSIDDAFDSSFRFLDSWRRTQRERILAAVRKALDAGCHALILPELSVPFDLKRDLAEATKNRAFVFVGGCEYNERGENCAFIALDGDCHEQPKLVKSPYDHDEMVAGNSVNVFCGTCAGRFAVLVCADQVNNQVIGALKGRIDLLIVVARNRAIDTFASMAVGDAYRIYCFVVVANDARCGASLIVSPEQGTHGVQWLHLEAGSDLVYHDLPMEALQSRSRPLLKEIFYRTDLREESR